MKQLQPLWQEQMPKLRALWQDSSLSRSEKLAKLQAMRQTLQPTLKHVLTAEQFEPWQQQRGERRTQAMGRGPRPAAKAYNRQPSIAHLNNDALLDLVFAADPDHSSPALSLARYESKVYWNTGEQGARQDREVRWRQSRPVSGLEPPQVAVNHRCHFSPAMKRFPNLALDVLAGIRNSITGKPTEELMPDTDPDNGCRTHIRRYPSGRDGGRVEYWLVQGGGHTLPGNSRAPRPAMAALKETHVGKTSRDFVGLEVIWSAFKSCPSREVPDYRQ